MAEKSIKELIETALSGLDSVSNVNTIVGKPVETQNGTVIIPVSRINLGFGVGGSDFSGKQLDSKQHFGGGGGGGVTIEPVAFLVISNSGDIKLLNMQSNMPKPMEIIAPATELAAAIFGRKSKKDKKDSD